MSEVIKMHLQDGVNVGGGGGGSDAIWLPNVSEQGVISWTKSTSTTAPTERNIKGADGADGQDGADGRGITSIVKTATSGNVDTYTITYSDGTPQTYTVTNGVNGQDGDDGLGIKSVDINAINHLIITYDDDTTKDAGEIQGGGGTTVVANPTLVGTEDNLTGLQVGNTKYKVPSGDAIIDDTTPSSNKVFSSQKVNTDFLAMNRDIGGASVTVTASPYNGASITRISDTEYIISRDGSKYTGILWTFNADEIKDEGVHICFSIQRNQTDAGSNLLIGNYVRKSNGEYATYSGQTSIRSSQTGTVFERFYSPAFITENTYNGTFTLMFSLNTASNLTEKIYPTQGVSAQKVNVVGLNTYVFAPLNGRKALFLGDSITEFNNNRSWVNTFAALTGVEIVANVAVAGAQLHDKDGTVYDGDPKESVSTNNVLGNQVQKIINNQYAAPDLIIIAIGVNGGITADSTRITESYIKNSAVVPLADVDRTYSEGAFRYCNETLHNLYPHAEIFWCAPIQAAYGLKNFATVYSSGDNLLKLTRYGSSRFVDTYRCGIRIAKETANAVGEYLQDGLHPTDKGAFKIALYNANEIVNQMRVSSEYKDIEI